MSCLEAECTRVKGNTTAPDADATGGTNSKCTPGGDVRLTPATLFLAEESCCRSEGCGMDVLEATDCCAVKVEPESMKVFEPDYTAANDLSDEVTVEIICTTDEPTIGWLRNVQRLTLGCLILHIKVTLFRLNTLRSRDRVMKWRLLLCFKVFISGLLNRCLKRIVLRRWKGFVLYCVRWSGLNSWRRSPRRLNFCI